MVAPTRFSDPTPVAAPPVAAPPVRADRPVILLATDIQGSSRLWEHFPEAMRAAVARHDALLRNAIQQNSGEVWSTAGDSFLAAFDSAAGAAQAAVTAMRALAAERWEETGEIRIRAALHRGNPEHWEGDPFGRPQDRVSRLLSAAHGGQILLSPTAQESLDLAAGELPPGITLHSLGEYAFADLRAPMEIWQLRAPGLQSEFSPPRARSTERAADPDLVGRDAELAAAGDLLTHGGVRLLTLVGPGGTGKTRLARGLATALTGEFSDGVWVVPLASLRETALVPAAVSRALGLPEGGGSLEETLLEYLKERRLLLVLDNFEQLVGAANWVHDCLTRAPGVRVLVTSRSALHLSGEREFPVPPLALPTVERFQTPEELLRSPAVALFARRAAEARPGFRVTPENAGEVARICARMDGLPLALELAAARLRRLTPRALLAQLEGRVRVVAAGEDTSPYGQTLREAVRWSYDLLSPAERGLFRWTAIFQGGFSLEAVEEVLSLGAPASTEELDPLDGVVSLVDQSLLRRADAADQEAEARYEMLEVLREFGLEELEAAGELNAATEAHGRWCEALLDAEEPRFFGAEQQAALSHVEREHGNLRAALDRWSDTEPRRALAMGGRLWWFWYVRGYFAEGRRRLETLARLTREDGPTAARGLAFHGAATLCWAQGDHETGWELFREALAIRREIGEPKSLSSTLNNMGCLAREQGDFVKARAYFEEALALRRAMGDRHAVAGTLANLGVTATDQGDYPAALALNEEALEIYRSLGDAHAVATILGNQGRLEFHYGDQDVALRHFEESLQLRRELAEPRGIIMALIGVASWRLNHGSVEASREVFTEALELSREIGARWQESYCVTGLATAAAETGDWLEARRLYQEGLRIRAEVQDLTALGESLARMGEVAVALNQPELAVRLFASEMAHRGRAGYAMVPDVQTVIDHSLEVARAALGEAGFAAEWREGGLLSWREAAELGLTVGGEQVARRAA